jgi:hypothetical protein
MCWLGSARLAQEAEGAGGRLGSSSQRGIWHADCLVAGMSDENYSLVLLQIICLLMFSFGVMVLTQHPEWFGMPNKTAAWRFSQQQISDFGQVIRLRHEK